ncbi:MAG: hypothetical protein U5N56_09865 [Candidatus Marinimicrobia bacterium]|nr:hypothetical protein [Candidatus Neomarinimicrobiota bacterium]
MHVTFAVITAAWANDNPEETGGRRKLLRVNADWAQKAFDGEDINGNGVLDEGEDLNGNGVLDRYASGATALCGCIRLRIKEK